MSRKKIESIIAEVNHVREQTVPKMTADEQLNMLTNFINRVISITEVGTLINKLKKCPNCGGLLYWNVSKLEVDFDCQRCKRGWKYFEGKWYSRSTICQEICEEIYYD